MNAVRVVVTDANVLINLLNVARLGLLGDIPGYEFVVPDDVVAEIRMPDHRTSLEAAFVAGTLAIESIVDPEMLVTFSDLTTRLGRGESACLALAAKRGWSIASDEGRRFRREALAQLGEGRILGTLEIFLLALEANLLTLEEADADREVLESRRFKSRAPSFRELLASRR